MIIRKNQKSKTNFFTVMFFLNLQMSTQFLNKREYDQLRSQINMSSILNGEIYQTKENVTSGNRFLYIATYDRKVLIECSKYAIPRKEGTVCSLDLVGVTLRRDRSGNSLLQPKRYS